MKAGILEVADIFVVNKADRDGAGQLVTVINAMLSLGHGPAGCAAAGTDDRSSQRRGHP